MNLSASQLTNEPTNQPTSQTVHDFEDFPLDQRKYEDFLIALKIIKLFFYLILFDFSLIQIRSEYAIDGRNSKCNVLHDRFWFRCNVFYPN